MAEYSCVSPALLRPGVLDVFGAAPNGSVWTKLSNNSGKSWEPLNGFQYVAASAKDCPSVTVSGPNQTDVYYVNKTGNNVLHKYLSAGTWLPAGSEQDDLGGNVTAVTSVAWGPNTTSLVGHSVNGSYAHRVRNQTGWQPADSWEDLGRNFFSSPAVVSWGPGRFDVAGFDSESGSLWHRFFLNGTQASAWEDLQGGPFIGNPVASSWGVGRLDFWAIDSEGELNHKFWDGHQWQGWEQLGGRFTDTPKVVHFEKGRIDIVGKNIDDDKYYLKSYDGTRWNPDPLGWWELAGPFTSEPGFVSENGTSK